MVEYTSKNKKRPKRKMQLIKTQNNYKSINELLDKTLDKTVNENITVIQEQPLFHKCLIQIVPYHPLPNIVSI